MRPILETINRPFVELLKGSPDKPAVDPSSERSQALIRNLIGGGLALGGGTSLLVAVANHMKALREEAELEDDRNLDDDTFYVPLSKKADVNKWLAPGVGITGGIASAAGAYALVQLVSTALQKQRRKALLDDAQVEALAASDHEGDLAKAAAADAKINGADAAVGLPVALTLLSTIVAGGLTYTALNKHFPVVKKPKTDDPTRFKISYGTPPESEEEEPQEKMASDFSAAGREFLSGLVYRMGGQNNVTRDLVAYAATGGIRRMEQAVKSGSHQELLELTAGAHNHTIPGKAMALANIMLHKSASLSPVVEMLSASEYYERSPSTVTALIYGNTPGTLTKVASVGSCLGLLSRQRTFPELMSKQASALPDGHNDAEILALLEQQMQEQGLAGEQLTGNDQEQQDAVLNSDVHGSMSDNSEEAGDDRLATHDDANQSTDDVIDDVLSGQPSPDKVVPRAN